MLTKDEVENGVKVAHDSGTLGQIIEVQWPSFKILWSDRIVTSSAIALCRQYGKRTNQTCVLPSLMERTLYEYRDLHQVYGRAVIYRTNCALESAAVWFR
jgi:hypothetical protein